MKYFKFRRFTVSVILVMVFAINTLFTAQYNVAAAQNSTAADNIAKRSVYTVYTKGGAGTSGATDYVRLEDPNLILTDGTRNNFSGLFKNKYYEEILVEMDLNSVLKFNNVVLFDSRFGGFGKYLVSVSDDGENWEYVQAGICNWEQYAPATATTSSNGKMPVELSIDFPEQSARYIQILLGASSGGSDRGWLTPSDENGNHPDELNKNGWIKGCLDEIEVYYSPRYLSAENFANKNANTSVSAIASVSSDKINEIAENIVKPSNVNGETEDCYFAYTNTDDSAKRWIAADFGYERTFNELGIISKWANIDGFTLYSLKEDEYNELSELSRSQNADVTDNLLDASGVISRAQSIVSQQGIGDAFCTEDVIFNSIDLNESIDTDRANPITCEFDDYTARYVLLVIDSLTGADEDMTAKCAVRSVEFYSKEKTKDSIGQYEPNFCTMSENMAKGKNTYASANGSEKLTDGYVGKADSFWMTDDTGLGYFIVDFGKTELADTVIIDERFNRIKEYSLSYGADGADTENIDRADWVEISAGRFESENNPNTNINISHKLKFGTIAARYLMFEIKSGYVQDSGFGSAVDEFRAYYTADGTEINLSDRDENGMIKGVTNRVDTQTTSNNAMLCPSEDNYTLCTYSSSASNTWCAVDLSRKQKFNRIQIVPCSDMITDYSIYVTNDATVWNTIESTLMGHQGHITDDVISKMDHVFSDSFDYEYNFLEFKKTNFINTNVSRDYVITADFSEVEARYIAVVFTGERMKGQPINIWSFETYDIDREGNKFYEKTGNETENPDTALLENLALGKPLSASAGYNGEKTGNNFALLTDGERFDGLNRVYITGKMPISIDIDLQEVKPIDRVVFYEFGGKLKKYSVYVSDDGARWTLVDSYENNNFVNNNIPDYSQLDFEVVFGRYLRLEIDEVYQTAALSELEVYSVNPDAIVARELDYSSLTDEPKEAVTADLLSLPARISNNLTDAAVTWRSSMPDVINPVTGKVKRDSTDKTVVLTASIDVGSSRPVVKSFTFTVKKADTEAYEKIETMHQSEDNISFVEEHGFKIGNNAVFEFSAQGDGSLKLKNMSFPEIVFDGGEIRVEYSDKVFSRRYLSNELKTKIEAAENVVNIYTDDGMGYRMLANDIPTEDFSSFEGFETTGSLSVAEVEAYIPQDKLLDTVFEQFDWSKLSAENQYNLISGLNLFESIYKTTITYTSDDAGAIDLISGEILENGKNKIYANISYGEKVKTVGFEYICGNLIGSGAVTADAAAVNSNVIGNIKDGSLATAFLTKVGSYDILLDLGAKKYVSDIFISSYTPSEIKRLEILTGEGTDSYESVYITETADSVCDISIEPKKIRYIKISVRGNEGAQTGFNEISVYFKPNTDNKLKADIGEVVIPENMKGDFILPKTGSNGCSISYSCDKDYVKFASGVNNGMNIEINRPLNDEYAKITAVASLNGNSVSKTYNLLIYGTRSINSNTPDQGNITDKGSGGGLGGGGVVSITSAPAAAEEKNIYSETRGHWAEKEINYLLVNKIVQGNGKSLALEENITRAEFAVLVSRAMGLSPEGYAAPYNDVNENDWFASSVSACTKAGIVSGDNGSFYPERFITREEMAKIISGFLNDNDNGGYSFTDSANISEWAVSSVNICIKNNMLKGYEDGSFKPKNNLKRAEAFSVVYRLLVNKVEE